MSAQVIHFFRPEDAYGGFSNHSAHAIELHGKRWSTTEHYFQAQKFVGTEQEEKIRLEPSSQVAAQMGRDRSFPIRKDWEAVKENLMREALLAKFTQHADLKALLLSTGDAQIVEHTPSDAYWGDGADGCGKNRLGILLMEIRQKLREGN
ncbi:MAG TPA: NADAR family protein [Verrucomicrobiae bacterium]